MRSNSLIPSSASRSLIWRDNAGCAIPSCKEARETVPCSATVMKVRKWRRSITADYAHSALSARPIIYWTQDQIRPILGLSRTARVKSGGRHGQTADPNVTSIAASALLFSVPAFAHEHDGAQFGTVHFPISCNEAAQQHFDDGMRYQHSFWWSRAKQSFEDALKADPECGIAYWGIALTLL